MPSELPETVSALANTVMDAVKRLAYPEATVRAAIAANVAAAVAGAERATAITIAFQLRHMQLSMSEYDMQGSDSIERAQHSVMQRYGITDHDFQVASQVAHQTPEAS